MLTTTTTISAAKIYTRPKKYEKVAYEEQTESEAEQDQ